MDLSQDWFFVLILGVKSQVSESQVLIGYVMVDIIDNLVIHSEKNTIWVEDIEYVLFFF